MRFVSWQTMASTSRDERPSSSAVMEPSGLGMTISWPERGSSAASNSREVRRTRAIGAQVSHDRRTRRTLAAGANRDAADRSSSAHGTISYLRRLCQA